MNRGSGATTGQKYWMIPKKMGCSQRYTFWLPPPVPWVE